MAVAGLVVGIVLACQQQQEPPIQAAAAEAVIQIMDIMALKLAVLVL